jgi:hypothetical protein
LHALGYVPVVHTLVAIAFAEAYTLQER